MNNNVDLIFNGTYTFLPNKLMELKNNKNDELDKMVNNNDNHTETPTNSPTTLSIDNNSTAYSNCSSSNDNCSTRKMSYNEFKYKINNYKKEYFNELSKLFKCPLGFSILSHYISRGYKDECIELIKLGYNPNEVDTLNRNSYYWSDYYKYDNNNEIDSKWLKNIYLEYKEKEDLDLLSGQLNDTSLLQTKENTSLCYLTITDENTISIKINNNDEAFKPIFCSLIYTKEDVNNVVVSQEVLDVEKCTCNLPSNNHDDNNAKFQIKVGSGKYSNEINTFLIITISNKGAFEDEEGINRVETSKFISMTFALFPNYDAGVCSVAGFCVANKYFTTLWDSIEYWFLKPKRGLENVERGGSKLRKNEKGYNVVMEEDTPFKNLEDEQEYEKMVVEEFRYECSECLKLIRGFDGLLLENQTLFEFNYLTSIVNKSSGISDALKLAVPSKFLANNIGKIGSSHKDVPFHFVVKALIFKNNEKEECLACILFGKWLVKYESGLVVMEKFQNDTNLIYSTDIFRVDANHNGYNEDLLNTFIYKFAQFCCWWNGLGRDEINSFHFIYSLIKYLDLEENLTKNDDLLIPYIQNIVVYGGFTLCYYPTNEFISTIRELIKNKGIINNESWEHFHKTLLKDTKPVIEFYEPYDVDSYFSFIEYYYPDYLHQSKRSLGILRNIIISNISKFNDLNKESVEKYSSLAGNSRINYAVGRSSVIDGRLIPEEFMASEELLEKHISEYCKRVTKFK